MGEFDISLRSFSQVQAFVDLAMRQSCEVLVGNDTQQINGKDIMGVFSLDHSRPVTVKVNCGQEEFLAFQQAAALLPL